jgi:hypothetical protein
MDLGTRLVEVNDLQSLLVLLYCHHLSLLLGLNIVQCTERRHHESGLIISLRQMSFGLLLLLVI